MIAPVFLQLLLHGFNLFLYADAVIPSPGSYFSSKTTSLRSDSLETLQTKRDELTMKCSDLHKDLLVLEDVSSQLPDQEAEMQEESNRLDKLAEMKQKEADHLQTNSSLYRHQSAMLHEKSLSRRTESDTFMYEANIVLMEINRRKNEPTRAPRKSPTVWPYGNVALLKPYTGCPKYSHHHPGTWEDGLNRRTWEDGYYKFHTESSKYPNRDFISIRSHMASPVSRRLGDQNIFYMHQCVKKHDELIGPVWPRGKYCVLKAYDDFIPDVFHHASFMFDAEDDHPYLSEVEGNPKPYIRKGDLEVPFLCRGDADHNTPMELPVDVPFYLFRYRGKCQQVLNAKVTEESFTLDREDSHVDELYVKQDRDPDITIDTNVARFHTCYYERAV